ncbi:MAG TPA: hypothetical protein VJG90_09290 [Candidatus Nanoarchaeia archaeon]|nr:hypothetical protein [Candidatus Nanoarchaeia archaeon]
MLGFVLMLLDIWCAIALLFLQFSTFPTKWVLYCVGYLWLKAIIWRGSLMNLFDVAVGVYMLLMLMGVHSFLTYIAIAYFIYKVIASLGAFG